MNITIHPVKVKGIIKAPASKSMMQRAIAIGLLANGNTIITNPTFCNDSISAISVALNLGATIEILEDRVIIQGNFNPVTDTIHCGESGLCIRMFAPIAALSDKNLLLTGEGSLLTRPVGMLEAPMSDFGIFCQTNNNLLPVQIKGPYRYFKANIDGSISSQLLTGFLLALPLRNENSTLHVKNLKSKPYIDMTLEIMKEFGTEATHINYEEFSIKGNQTYIARNYEIEGDWSSAAFMLVAGAIGGEIEIQQLNIHSKQADKAIITALEKAGATTMVKNHSVFVKKNQLNAFEFDATDCPDLFPPLVTLAANCKGISVIKGISRLKHKESNRAETLKNEFAKTGISIRFDNDDMLIKGSKMNSADIDSHNDHRIAMSLTIAAINAENSITIKNSECVSKSYPEFFKEIKKWGDV